MAKYTLYPRAFDAAILTAEFMRRDMHERAVRVKEAAEATAPVDEHSKHPGRYRDSFEVVDETFVGPGSRGGARASSLVVNNAPEALYVEFGNENTPEHATLRRALDAVG